MPCLVRGRARLPIDLSKMKVPSTVILCPHCRTKSHFSPMIHCWQDETKAWVVQKCDSCSEMTLTIFQPSGTVSTHPEGGYTLDLKSTPEEVYPYFIPIPHDSIPEEIAEDYKEAVICFSAGAFNASVVMSRRAIETTAILLGANPTDRLKDKIKYLASKGLEQSLVDLATEIRLLGNVPAAHADKNDLLRKVTPAECKDVLDFLEAFLESLYIRPSKIKKMKSKRI